MQIGWFKLVPFAVRFPLLINDGEPNMQNLLFFSYEILLNAEKSA